jgi:hypothetical protein
MDYTKAFGARQAPRSTRVRIRNPYHDDPGPHGEWTAYVGFDPQGFPYIHDEVSDEIHVLSELEKLRCLAERPWMRPRRRP